MLIIGNKKSYINRFETNEKLVFTNSSMRTHPKQNQKQQVFLINYLYNLLATMSPTTEAVTQKFKIFQKLKCAKVYDNL